MRRSIARSNTSISRCPMVSSSQSRASGRLGFSAKTLRRSNSVLHQHVPVEVEDAPAHADAARRRRRQQGNPGATENALHPGQQLAWIEGLGDIIVGTGFEADDPVDRIAGRRHHDDADLAAALAQPAGDGEAVLPGQADIEQDQIRQLALHQPAQPAARFEAADPEALLGQIVEQKLALGRLVLDHRYMLPLIHLAPGRHRSICRRPALATSTIQSQPAATHGRYAETSKSGACIT